MREAAIFRRFGRFNDDMVKKWIATDFGGLDALTMVDVDVPPPVVGEVTIEVRASGMNPGDYKHVAWGTNRDLLPVTVGHEVAGVITAIGETTQIASGGGAVGDEVVAFRVYGGYTAAMTVPAKDVFAKPANLSFSEAANLLLAGTTATLMLESVDIARGDTVLIHGASGAIGVALLQLARLEGIRVIGTASPARFPVVQQFGGHPVAYGDGLESRVREAAPEGISVALDTAGTDEAVDVSLALVADRRRILSVAAMDRAEAEGYVFLNGLTQQSAILRDAARGRLLQLAADGLLRVPVAREFPLAEAKAALELLSTQHAGGKLALVS